MDGMELDDDDLGPGTAHISAEHLQQIYDALPGSNQDGGCWQSCCPSATPRQPAADMTTEQAEGMKSLMLDMVQIKGDHKCSQECMAQCLEAVKNSNLLPASVQDDWPTDYPGMLGSLQGLAREVATGDRV